MGQTHVVGAGIAGLSTAVKLTSKNQKATLYEAAGHAGGRCRSFFDETIDRVIDNGNHLLMSANTAALEYLECIGAQDTLTGPTDAVFPFLDLATGERWSLRPNNGPLPYWIFQADRRVSNTKPTDYLGLLRIPLAGPTHTVLDMVPERHPLFETMIKPLTVAVLNTSPSEGSAQLLWSVLARTFAKGGQACRPLIAKDGLSSSLVDPAISYLEANGSGIQFNKRLRVIECDGERISALDFGDRKIKIAHGDNVVFALPPAAIALLLPETPTPTSHNAIVNAHIRLPEPASLPDGQSMLGLIGGVVDWIFIRGDIASITISAADALAEKWADDVAALIWADTSKALGLDAALKPPIRVIKEKRATFHQTPDEVKRRPKSTTKFSNLFLAGDWTDTGLPATIEGAITSGVTAAGCVLSQ
jgi:squalene-associated FAD-dependent desaturase